MYACFMALGGVHVQATRWIDDIPSRQLLVI